MEGVGRGRGKGWEGGVRMIYIYLTAAVEGKGSFDAAYANLIFLFFFYLFFFSSSS